MRRPNVRIAEKSGQGTACPLVHVVDAVAVVEREDPGYWTLCEVMFDRAGDLVMCSEWVARDVDEPATCLDCLGGTPWTR